MRCTLLSVGVGVGILAACKLPEAPQWDIEVILPYASDTLPVLDYLPGSVSLDTVGGIPVFATQSRADSVEYRLGRMCTACQTLNGQTVQVPSFEYVDSLDVPFPAELVTIQVISALLEIRVTNRLNFDPLKPDPDPADAGYLALVSRDVVTGTTIDSVLISGANETMMSGATKTVQFQIADKEISEGVRIVFHVVSPQDSQTVMIDTTQVVKVAVLLGSAQVRNVAVVVDNRTMDEREQIQIDQTVRDALANRAEGGRFEFVLRHNLDLEGVFRTSIAGSPEDIFSGDPNRDITLDQLVLTADLPQTKEVTAEQLKRIATFESVYIAYQAVASGTQTGPSGQQNVARFTPEQFLFVQLRLRSVRRIEF